MPGQGRQRRPPELNFLPARDVNMTAENPPGPAIRPGFKLARAVNPAIRPILIPQPEFLIICAGAAGHIILPGGHGAVAIFRMQPFGPGLNRDALHPQGLSQLDGPVARVSSAAGDRIKFPVTDARRLNRQLQVLPAVAEMVGGFL